MKALRNVSDYELDIAVESYYDRMYTSFYGDENACCRNCENYCSDGMCQKKLGALTEEELEKMEETGYSAVEVYADDWCEDHAYADDEPEWESEDSYDDY